jgi:hypothetical protein
MVLAKGMSGGNGGSGEGVRCGRGGGCLARRAWVRRRDVRQVAARETGSGWGGWHVGSLLGSPGPAPTNSAIYDLKRFCKLTQICNEKIPSRTLKISNKIWL